MNEASFWRSIKLGLEKISNGEIFLERVENKLSSGLPDVHFCYKSNSGWIELKYISDYPKLSSTPIKIPHFNKYQKFWLKYYTGRVLGKAWILIRIKNDIFLIYGNNADKVGELNKEELIQISTGHWEKKIDYKEMLTHLITGNL